ncbi:hypothetical protein J6590_045264 [Homalodisca vitripennis]|nr:hypothetical protein J6590_045264 [Homalodisca vitripennis]
MARHECHSQVSHVRRHVGYARDSADTAHHTTWYYECDRDRDVVMWVRHVGYARDSADTAHHTTWCYECDRDRDVVIDRDVVMGMGVRLGDGPSSSGLWCDRDRDVVMWGDM